jgi:hypothetical protein
MSRVYGHVAGQIVAARDAEQVNRRHPEPSGGQSWVIGVKFAISATVNSGPNVDTRFWRSGCRVSLLYGIDDQRERASVLIASEASAY